MVHFLIAFAHNRVGSLDCLWKTCFTARHCMHCVFHYLPVHRMTHTELLYLY